MLILKTFKRISLATASLQPRFQFSRLYFTQAKSNTEAIEELKKIASSSKSDELDKYSLLPKTKEVLRQRGIVDLLPIQREMFNPICKKESVVGRDITGSGKTLAYVIPILETLRTDKLLPKKAREDPFALVVVPTRELAIQTTREFHSLRHWPTEFFVKPMYGGIPDRLRTPLRFGPDIIVGTPGRIIDNINKGSLKLSSVRSLVIDEAHRMMEDNFIKDIDFIYNSLSKSRKESTQLVMLSATFPSYIRSRVKDFCKDGYKLIDLAKDLKNRTPATVKHLVLRTPHEQRPKLLLQLLKKYVGDESKKALVFANTKAGVKDLIRECKLEHAQPLHGDMTQYERERVFNKFRKGEASILFATDVAARGLDIPDLDLVVQLEPTPDADLYVHRAGRTARAGKSGVVVSVWNEPNEIASLRRIEHAAGVKFCKIELDEAKGEIKETQEVVSFGGGSYQNKEQYEDRSSYWGSKKGKPYNNTRPRRQDRFRQYRFRQDRFRQSSY